MRNPSFFMPRHRKHVCISIIFYYYFTESEFLHNHNLIHSAAFNIIHLFIYFSFIRSICEWNLLLRYQLFIYLFMYILLTKYFCMFFLIFFEMGDSFLTSPVYLFIFFLLMFVMPSFHVFSLHLVLFVIYFSFH